MPIRIATVEDIPQLQYIRGAVKENVLNNPLLVTLEDYVSLLNYNGKGWVHQIDNSITGFAIVDTQKNNVWALFVDPAFEQKGIGRMLHDEMVSWYFQNQQQPLWLTTAAGTRAELFYRLSGWKQTGINASNEVIFEITPEAWLERKNQFPVLNSDRIQLRPARMDDVNNLFSIRTNKEVNQYLERTPPSQLSDVNNFIQNIKKMQYNRQGFYWIIEEKTKGQFLGTICLFNLDHQTKSVEIGYELLPEHQGKGYMNEAIDAVIFFVQKTLHLSLINAYSAIGNESSSRLLQKKGFAESPSEVEELKKYVFSLTK